MITLRHGTLAVVPLLAAGCGHNPFGLIDYSTPGPPMARLREIDTVELERQSRAEPTTVDEAAEDAIDEMLRREPPPEIELALDEVRAAALANNLDLMVVLVDPSISDTLVNEEEARFESTFFASARHSNNESPTASPLLQGTEDTQDNFDLGVTIPVVTGGTVTVDLPFSKFDTDRVGTVINPSYGATLQFSISQPLLRGGGIKANTHSIRVALDEQKISNARTKLEAIRILANADRAYWVVYAARRQLEVRLQQYQLAIEQLEQARRLVNAGQAAELEVTRAQSGVASSLENIIVAEILLRRRQRDLKRIMNRPDLPMDSPTAIIPATIPDPVYLDLDPITLGETAVANRMEMLELELQLAIDASTIDFEKNNALPLFTLDYVYNINGLSTSFDGAFSQIADTSFTGWQLGLNVEIPIGNEAAQARVERAILTRVQRLATRDLRRQAILQEVYDAVDLLHQEWQRILAARQSSILAGRTYEGEKRAFEQGLRTSTDVLDAAARLADAQSSEVAALADYEIASVDLAFGTGTLLGKGRIRWEPTGTNER